MSSRLPTVEGGSPWNEELSRRAADGIRFACLAAETATPEPRPLHRIVIVEPQDDNAGMYAELLRGRYATARAAPGAAALAAANADAVIVEVAHATGDGFGGIPLCGELARRYPFLAILILTSRTELVVPSFHAGCHSVMVKPIRAETLVDRVTALLHGAPHLLVRPFHAPCRQCPRSEGEAFDHAPVGGVWLMCRPCGAVWLDPLYESRMHTRFVGD